MYSVDDTIVAISTPLGESGIGIVRMSGPQARNILRRLFVLGALGAPPPRAEILPRALHYGHIVEPDSGEMVDEVLAAYMPAPKTFTRQDVVEINGHGGLVALRQILKLCLRQGARLAEPGEFTVRAFLNGRLDLAQAEAVLDVVRAKTEKSLQVAVGQLVGRLSEQVQSIRSVLVDLLAYLEASIDFGEDEIPERHIAPDLAQCIASLERLLADADRGIVFRQGVRVAIIGRPNVGKSSLLNRMLRTSRAIVTEFPGTTRDTLEETYNLSGIPILLVDTAGFSVAATDPVERLGIERSREALARADLALLVFDISQPPSEADEQIAALVGNRPAILVLNKIDLVPADDWEFDNSLWRAPRVPVSALTGEGLEALESAIVDTVLSGQVSASEAPLVTSPRHKEALCRAAEHVQAALSAHSDGQPADMVAIDLAGAVNALGEITGQTASEDLLESIFANFCVGK